MGEYWSIESPEKTWLRERFAKGGKVMALGDKALEALSECYCCMHDDGERDADQVAAIQDFEALRAENQDNINHRNKYYVQVQELQAALAKAEADKKVLQNELARGVMIIKEGLVVVEELEANVAVLLSALEWYEVRVRHLPGNVAPVTKDDWGEIIELFQDAGKRAAEAIAKVKGG